MASPRGKVWLYRSVLDHEVFQDDWLWRLFSWCLLRANYKADEYHGVTIPRGSFVTGRNSAATELHTSPSRVYRGLDALAEIGCIKIKPNKNWTMVTVCNFNTYQDRPGNSEQQRELSFSDEADSERTASGQRADTIKEGNNSIMEESIHPSRAAEGSPKGQGADGRVDEDFSQGEGDRGRTGWGLVQDRLAALGATRWREATREARDAGCTPGQAMEILAYAAKNNFQVGAIICRLSCARPTMPIDQGWVTTAPPVPPKVAADKAKAKADDELNNSLATDFIKKCRKAGIVEESAIKSRLAERGLHWPTY